MKSKTTVMVPEPSADAKETKGGKPKTTNRDRWDSLNISEPSELDELIKGRDLASQILTINLSSGKLTPMRKAHAAKALNEDPKGAAFIDAYNAAMAKVHELASKKGGKVMSARVYGGFNADSKGCLQVSGTPLTIALRLARARRVLIARDQILSKGETELHLQPKPSEPNNKDKRVSDYFLMRDIAAACGFTPPPRLDKEHMEAYFAKVMAKCKAHLATPKRERKAS